jgi:hypothetical protein
VDVAAECARRAQSSVPRLRQLVVRFSDQELREIRAAAASAGLAVGAWAGESVVAAARAAEADAGFAERALLRALIEAQAASCAADDAAMGALVDGLIDVLVARLS